jgi:hypothetical protein
MFGSCSVFPSCPSEAAVRPKVILFPRERAYLPRIAFDVSPLAVVFPDPETGLARAVKTHTT